MDIIDLTVHELMDKLKSRELTAYDITKAYAHRINDKEKDVEAFVTILSDEALSQAKDIDLEREKRKFRRLCRYSNRY